jgi:hypothetical protein
MQPVNQDDPPSRSSAKSRSNGEVAPAINRRSVAVGSKDAFLARH